MVKGFDAKFTFDQLIQFCVVSGCNLVRVGEFIYSLFVAVEQNEYLITGNHSCRPQILKDRLSASRSHLDLESLAIAGIKTLGRMNHKLFRQRIFHEHTALVLGWFPQAVQGSGRGTAGENARLELPVIFEYLDRLMRQTGQKLARVSRYDDLMLLELDLFEQKFEQCPLGSWMERGLRFVEKD